MQGPVVADRGRGAGGPRILVPGARRRHRLLRDISLVLIISGVLLLVDAGVTLLWQEPLTAVVALIKRGEVDKRFLSYRAAPLSQVDRRALAAMKSVDERIAYLARQERRAVKTGDAIGTIEAPSIGTYTVVQGTDDATLQKGPGHYPQTAFPGVGQTVAIAGHRTTYLAPFRHLNALRPGQKVVLTLRYGRFTYTVQYSRVVDPTAWWITRNVGYDRLVLSACNPLYSASQRIVVFARLQQVVPLGAALGS
jgi:sortase A